MKPRIKQLYEDSAYIIREAIAEYECPAFMWAGGKDSTLMLYIAKQCLPPDKMPPALFLDTTFQFRETYDFIRSTKQAWNYPRKPQQFPIDNPSLLLHFLEELDVKAQAEYYDLETGQPCSFAEGQYQVIMGVKQ